VSAPQTTTCKLTIDRHEVAFDREYTPNKAFRSQVTNVVRLKYDNAIFALTRNDMGQECLVRLVMLRGLNQCLDAFKTRGPIANHEVKPLLTGVPDVVVRRTRDKTDLIN